MIFFWHVRGEGCLESGLEVSTFVSVEPLYRFFSLFTWTCLATVVEIYKSPRRDYVVYFFNMFYGLTDGARHEQACAGLASLPQRPSTRPNARGYMMQSSSDRSKNIFEISTEQGVSGEHTSSRDKLLAGRALPVDFDWLQK